MHRYPVEHYSSSCLAPSLSTSNIGVWEIRIPTWCCRRISYRSPDLASVACRGRPKLPKILPAELGSAFVAYGECNIGRAVIARQQKLPRLLQPELLVILERVETGHCQKTAMQACAAHTAYIAQVFYSQLCVLIVPDPAWRKDRTRTAKSFRLG